MKEERKEWRRGKKNERDNEVKEGRMKGSKEEPKEVRKKQEINDGIE